MPDAPDADRGDIQKSRPVARVVRDAVRKTASEAETEEYVRAFLAIWLVLVLIVLVFFNPNGGLSSEASASVQTLTFAVIAFYFGLHKGTPGAERARRDEQRGRSSEAAEESPPNA